MYLVPENILQKTFIFFLGHQQFSEMLILLFSDGSVGKDWQVRRHGSTVTSHNFRNTHLLVLHTRKTCDTFRTSFSWFLHNPPFCFAALCQLILPFFPLTWLCHCPHKQALSVPWAISGTAFCGTAFCGPEMDQKVKVMLVFRTIPCPGTRQGEKCGSEIKN